MQSRVVEYKGDHYLQHFLNGKWATICQTDLPLTMSSTATSGSSNDHARLAPSDAKRWTNCTAAIAFEKENEDRIFEDDVRRVLKLTPYLKSLPPEELYPHEGRAMRWVRDVREGRVAPKDLTPAQKDDIRRSEGSEYSREGTRAHDFSAAIFAGEKTLEDIPEDFRQPVGYYVDFYRSFLTDPGEQHFVETKVPLFYDRRSHGTRDFAIVRENRITIIDLKYGQGEPVDAKENPQCAIYGLSTVEDMEESGLWSFDPDTIVEIIIIQPRYHGDRPDKRWEVTLSDLRAFCEGIRAKHDTVVSGEGLEFNPSDDACHWCKCNAFCPARLEDATAALAGPDFSGYDLLADLPDLGDIEGTTTKKEFESRPAEERLNLRASTGGLPVPLSDETLIALFRKASAITDFLGDLKEYVADRVLSGDRFAEGKLKIVMGRKGDSEWVDEAAADKFLANRLKADERRTWKVITPTQAKKKIDLKKETTRFVNGLEALITRSDARKTVADINDKRDAVASDIDSLPVIEDEFEFPEGM